MTSNPDYRAAAALIILLGCGLAAAASLVPFYHVAFQVDTLALSVLLTPFVLYGMLLESLRGSWLLATGIVLLGVSLAVVLDERYPVYAGYHSVYWVPLLAAAIMLPIAYVFGRRAPYS